MQTSVTVAVRVRPLSSRERQEGDEECLEFHENQISLNGKSFTYDKVFREIAAQEEVFKESIEPLVAKFLEGYNSSILAYGQTGSGKTYTMGTGIDGNLNTFSQGILPRTLKMLFDQIEGCQDDFEMFVSFIEIYNEDIIDLLSPKMIQNNKIPLVIRQDSNGEVYLAGVTEEKVFSIDEVFE